MATCPAPLLDAQEDRSFRLLDALARREDARVLTAGEEGHPVLGRWYRERHPRRIRPSILYVDTRIEPPPIHAQAIRLLESLSRAYGIRVHRVQPTVEESFWTNLLGRGYPPPSRKFRWCTKRLKLAPALRFLKRLENPVSLVGTRFSESADRRRRLSRTCSPTTGECGTGSLADRLNTSGMPYVAPLLHWSTEDVWRFLARVAREDDLELFGLFDLYGDGDLRFGCWTCTLVKRDRSGEALLARGHRELAPLLEYRAWLVAEAARGANRYPRPNGVRGRLTLAFRQQALARLEAVERELGIPWLSPEERRRIRELWEDPRYGPYPRHGAAR